MNCSNDITGLLEVTKIQILKVIHNISYEVTPFVNVVGSHKDTNFESNSQPVPVASLYCNVLLEVTKIQILKVIHNNSSGSLRLSIVVGSHKDTNFESNSQLPNCSFSGQGSCWESQRYKF